MNILKRLYRALRNEDRLEALQYRIGVLERTLDMLAADAWEEAIEAELRAKAREEELRAAQAERKVVPLWQGTQDTSAAWHGRGE